METETIAAQSVEGVPSVTGSQETTPAPQGDAPLQETEQPKVEGQDNKPQATETPRAKPSDFYRERERVRRLEEAYKTQTQQIEEMKVLLKKLQPPEATETNGKFDWEEFLKNPENVLSAREKRYLDKIQKLESTLSEWQKSTTQESQAKSSREALEILFPKAGTDDNSELVDRIEQDPRKDMIDQLLKTPFVSRMWDENPQEAANYILFKLGSEKPAPTVLKKSVMGGTARGGPGMGNTPQAAKDAKLSEMRRLAQEMEKNESLRNDPKHKELRQKVQRELELLLAKE